MDDATVHDEVVVTNDEVATPDEMTLAEVQVADADIVREEVTLEDGAPVMEPYQVGFWHGIPNYKCPHCNFAIPSRDPKTAAFAIEQHAEVRHPDAWLEGV